MAYGREYGSDGYCIMRWQLKYLGLVPGDNR
jgi:hypothetical protein